MSFIEKGAIVSLDFGTTNIKCAAFDLYGNELAYESSGYRLYIPKPSHVENDLEKYWEIICSMLSSISKKLGSRGREVLAVCTSSQAETIVCVDKNVKPLEKAIVWIDTRTTRETEEIAANFDLEQMFEKTGYPEVDTSWPATRILWLKKNRPDIFNRTYKFLLIEDYLIYRLSGIICGEASLYNSSYYYDIMRMEYIDSMLDFIGISRERLPDILPPGTVVGKISSEVASITGFDKNTKVVIGAIDQICGALGAGNIKKGIATESTGSAFAMVITTGEPVIDYKYRLPCILHAVKDVYALMPYSSSGGMVLQWFKDNFCGLEEKTALKEGKNVFEILDGMAAQIPAGSEGLTVLPFLTGALFPEYNPDARAVYFGIGINHKKGHFIRAILESLGYMMRNDVEAVKKIGVDIKKIVSTGGGASSRLWSQIKSDICKIELQVPKYTETALLGSAAMAANAVGAYGNIAEAVENLLSIKERFIPEEKNGKIYDSAFKKYRQLYESLISLY